MAQPLPGAGGGGKFPRGGARRAPLPLCRSDRLWEGRREGREREREGGCRPGKPPSATGQPGPALIPQEGGIPLKPALTERPGGSVPSGRASSPPPSSLSLKPAAPTRHQPPSLCKRGAGPLSQRGGEEPRPGGVRPGPGRAALALSTRRGESGRGRGGSRSVPPCEVILVGIG